MPTNGHKNPSVGFPEEGWRSHATRFVAEVAASPCGNHLAREGRLARVSTLLLMHGEMNTLLDPMQGAFEDVSFFLNEVVGDQ